MYETTSWNSPYTCGCYFDGFASGSFKVTPPLTIRGSPLISFSLAAPALIRWSVHLATAGGFHEPLMIEGDVSLGQYIRNMGMNSPFGAAYAFQDA